MSLPTPDIATIEDCKVYRFADTGEYRYVTICPHANTTTVKDDRRTRMVGKTAQTYIVPSAIEAVRPPR